MVHGLTIRAVVAAIVLAACLSVVPSASAAFESASAKKQPWAGYWWPNLSTKANLYDNGRAMDKYDRYIKARYGTSSSAQAWEARNHGTSDTSATWWGHCHAWASAAVLTNTLPSSVTRSGVTFSRDDLEGLVTELYYQPAYRWLAGKRSFSDSPSDAAFQDIEPAWLDYVVRYYIGKHRYPIIMDMNADSQVWNFPAFAYRRWTQNYSDGSTGVTLQVWYTSASYNSTTASMYRNYTYRLKPGTLGYYTGNSVNNHPDYAYLPTGKRRTAEVNPHVSESILESIIGNGFNA